MQEIAKDPHKFATDMMNKMEDAAI